MFLNDTKRSRTGDRKDPLPPPRIALQKPEFIADREHYEINFDKNIKHLCARFR